MVKEPYACASQNYEELEEVEWSKVMLHLQAKPKESLVSWFRDPLRSNSVSRVARKTADEKF